MSSIYSPPRWSLSFKLSELGALVSKGLDGEEVCIEIPLNPKDLPPTATKVALSLSGFYKASVGNAVFRIRAFSSAPTYPPTPQGEIVAELTMTATATPTPIDDCIATISLTGEPVILQVTMCNTNANGETWLWSSTLTANGF